ncbi:MAG: helix-turn-helix domain-containing protein, partial [Alphaproteobacteria bacterium]
MRAQRQHLGYDLDSVSKETRIAVSHLRAIEDMTPNVIGQPVYVKGHIRTYARHLKMDPDAVLAQYKDECALLADPEKQDIAPPVSTRKLPVAIPAFGLLIVALIGAGGIYAVIQANGGTSASTKAATHATDTATSAAAIDAATAPVAPPLHIVALKEARIEVRGADGTKFLARDFAPGETYTPRVGAGWTVTTTDGSAFEWRLGDESLGLLAPEGPVYAQSVDIAVKREPINPPVVPDAAPSAPSPLDANARVPAPSATASTSPGGALAPKPAAGATTSKPGAVATAPKPVAGSPTVSGLPTAVKPRPHPPATQPGAAQANAGQPQIGTAPVPTAAPAANPTPVTDPSLLAYPPS